MLSSTYFFVAACASALGAATLTVWLLRSKVVARCAGSTAPAAMCSLSTALSAILVPSTASALILAVVTALEARCAASIAPAVMCSLSTALSAILVPSTASAPSLAVVTEPDARLALCITPATTSSAFATMVASPAITLSVVPLLVMPAPATIVPCVEYWENARLSVPTTSLPLLLVHTHPVSALVVPSSTNTKALAAPDVASMSAARVGAPDAFTVWMPFSLASV